MIFWTPLELLDYLESNGYKLKARDGRLVGPPGLAPEIVAAVKEHKASLITLITFQCPLCNQPVRTNLDTPNVLYIECVADPSHFSHMIPKHRNKPSFVTSKGIKPPDCKECGKPNDGDWKYCAACWLRFFEEDERAQKGVEA